MPAGAEARVQDIAAHVSTQSTSVLARLDALVGENRDIHEKACFNLNPATNVMNPRAEAIEVICAALCAEVFDAQFAEIRVSSGAIANLYGLWRPAKRGTRSLRRLRVWVDM